MSRAARAGALGALAALLVAPTVPAAAQEVTGRTVAEREGAVTGALVRIVSEDGAVSIRAESDSLGRFTARLPWPGRYSVFVERLGYAAPSPVTLSAAAGEVVELVVVLEAEPLAVDGVDARARSRAMSSLDAALRRIALDRRTGFGRNLLRKEIEARGAIDVPDVVATLSPLVRTRDPVSGEPAILLPSRNGLRPISERQPEVFTSLCSPSVYVDGLLMPEAFDAGEVTPDQLEAVELFFGLEAPPQFPDRGDCGGTVLLWTRAGASDAPRVTWRRLAAGGLAVAAILLLGFGSAP